MAGPKSPAGPKGGAKPPMTKQKTKGDVAAEVEPSATDSAGASGSPAPTNTEEVLAAINLEGLPHCPTEQILDILKEKYSDLVAVFANYCKQGSECTTISSSTRLKVAGFRKLVKDANLELKVFDFDAMARLFAQCSNKGGGGPGGGKAIPNPETVDLGMENFLTLMVCLAFGRDNPRYQFAKESAGKKEETVPVLQCVQVGAAAAAPQPPPPPPRLPRPCRTCGASRRRRCWRPRTTGAGPTCCWRSTASTTKRPSRRSSRVSAG